MTHNVLLARAPRALERVCERFHHLLLIIHFDHVVHCHDPQSFVYVRRCGALCRLFSFRVDSYTLGSKIQYCVNWIIFCVKIQWIFGRGSLDFRT